MRCHFSVLNKTQNGILLQMENCESYQLSYKNLNFHLTSKELGALQKYLEKIDVNYWEKEYEHSIYEKKIPIPTLQSNFIILLDKYELQELSLLLDYTKKIKMVNNKLLITSLSLN